MCGTGDRVSGQSGDLFETIGKSIKQIRKEDIYMNHFTDYQLLKAKKEYLIKTLSRTKRKDYENYVIGAIWHRLKNLE